MRHDKFYEKYNKAGDVKKKLLLLLIGTASLGLANSPKQQIWVLKQMGREWNWINKRALQRAIASLYKSKLIDIKENLRGYTEIVLNDNGKKRFIKYKIDELIIDRSGKWDRRWRMVIFDIPENHKKTREAIRGHLERLGFYKLQKSVFIFPYQCENEIEFILEYYNARRYVRQVIAEKIDNELHLKKIFKL